jgi:hypothetical protein
MLGGCADEPRVLQTASIKPCVRRQGSDPKGLNGSLSATQDAPWESSRQTNRMSLAQADC